MSTRNTTDPDTVSGRPSTDTHAGSLLLNSGPTSADTLTGRFHTITNLQY